ncbi:hypothetical protein [Mesorhizobium sp. WSM3866]|uniref:hypothetical protein n=1 Tax=Mesorhizobium sp. WSM3866 TaxID=422271 RepID=UPI0015967CCC|nr:hypothetical protein [Mesorhizobium sp. WSM3866]
MGLHAARRYAELNPDSSVILVDADRIGNNASGRFMGFVIDLAHNPRKQDFVEDIKGNKEELFVTLRDRLCPKRCRGTRRGLRLGSAGKVSQRRDCTRRRRSEARLTEALDTLGQSYSWVNTAEIQAMTGSALH